MLYCKGRTLADQIKPGACRYPFVQPLKEFIKDRSRQLVLAQGKACAKSQQHRKPTA